MSTPFCYFNDHFCRQSEAMIPVTDLTLQRGYGVFDYGRTHYGVLYRFEHNIDRLRRSAQALRLPFPYGNDQILQIAQELLRLNGLKDAALRMLLTGGDPETAQGFHDVNFLMTTELLPAYPATHWTEGVTLMTAEYRRELPRVKSLNYLYAMQLEAEKRARGASEILYTHEGFVTECSRSNFFVFLGETLVTPKEDILLGNTRDLVLSLVRGVMKVEERVLSLAEVQQASEAFITSTTRKAMPVKAIDGKPVGNGQVGPLTRRVMALFEEDIRAHCVTGVIDNP